MQTVNFENIKLAHPSAYYLPMGVEFPPFEQMWLELDEVAHNEGARYGFKYPKDKDGACFSITIDVSGEDLPTCVTVWSEDILGCVRKAWLILLYWEGYKDLHHALNVGRDETKRISANMKRAYEEGLSVEHKEGKKGANPT